MNDLSLIEFLKHVEIFSSFNQSELEQLAGNVQSSHYEFGATVLKAGDSGEGLYLIKSGRVRLFAEERGKEKSIGILEPGDTFGEISAVKEQQIDSSVRSLGKPATEILLFPRESVLRLLDKNETAKRFIAQYIALRAMGGFMTQMFDLRKKIDRAELQNIIQSIGIKSIGAGQKILTQDSAEDRRLYIVREGQIKIAGEKEGKTYDLMIHGPGEVFGEKACLMYSTQQANAVAVSDTVVVIIPQQTVHFILERNTGLRTVLEKRIEFTEKELERQVNLTGRKEGGFLFDLTSKSGPGERVLRRFPFVQQAEEMDCGAACLAMICKQYDIPMTLGKLREMANVTTEGATMDSVAKVGESLGFVTKGVQCTYKMMLDFELPFIAHWEGYHYIIVYGISKDHIWIADPARNFKKMSVSEFEKGWTGNCLLFSPTDNLARTAEKQSSWLRFIRYLKPFKRILIDMFLAALIIQILGLVSPLIIQNILDKVVVHQNKSLLNIMVMGLAITMVFSQITELLRAYLSKFMIRKMDFNMMSHFYKHILSLPISYFAKRKTGDIIARFQENNTIRRFMTENSINTLLNAMMVFIYFIVMFIYNVKLTLLLIAFLPPIIIVTLIASPRYRDYARRTFYAETDAESLLMETLGAAETVKGMGIERTMRLKWEKKYAKTLDLRYRTEIFTSLIETVTEGLKAACTLILLWIGSNLVISQDLTIGQLMAFNGLIGSVMGPVLGLVKIWDELQETLVAVERLGDVLELEPEQKPEDIASRIILPSLKGDMRFEGVYFRYSKESPYILKNINMEIKAGSTVAFVGHSGSGKTTLAKLLVGFYKPDEGKMYVDSYDMDALDMEYYRGNIGYVMQSNLLFSGTISENISMGDPNPDARRITEVAKLADAHGFISNMSLGYEQTVGERGTGLSGGQIQRICIARALYHNPGFLIFDEATSALDSESESHIQMSMRQILEGRTAVLIAHRLSTIMHADNIFVLYEGEIVEEGTHQELLEKKGMYFNLVKKQMSAVG